MVDFRINETRQTGAVRKTKLPFYRLVGAVSNCADSVRLKTAPTGPGGESVHLFLEFTINELVNSCTDELGSCQKKVRSTNRNRVLKKKLGFFALNLNMSDELLNDVETTSLVRNNDRCSLRTKGYYTVSLTSSAIGDVQHPICAWFAISGACVANNSILSCAPNHLSAATTKQLSPISVSKLPVGSSASSISGIMNERTGNRNALLFAST